MGIIILLTKFERKSGILLSKKFANKSFGLKLSKFIVSRLFFHQFTILSLFFKPFKS